MGRKTFLLGLLLCVGQPAAAGDKAAGQAKAVVCGACHSTGGPGLSTVDAFPNLAGQKHGYIIKQLKAFRSGQRKDPSMQSMAANLSDQDIEDLAAYFSSL